MTNDTTRWIYKLLRSDADALRFIVTIEDLPQTAIRDAVAEYIKQVDYYHVKGIDLEWISEAIVYDSHRYDAYVNADGRE